MVIKVEFYVNLIIYLIVTMGLQLTAYYIIYYMWFKKNDKLIYDITMTVMACETSYFLIENNL